MSSPHPDRRRGRIVVLAATASLLAGAGVWLGVRGEPAAPPATRPQPGAWAHDGSAVLDIESRSRVWIGGAPSVERLIRARLRLAMRGASSQGLTVAFEFSDASVQANGARDRNTEAALARPGVALLDYEGRLLEVQTEASAASDAGGMARALLAELQVLPLAPGAAKTTTERDPLGTFECRWWRDRSGRLGREKVRYSELVAPGVSGIRVAGSSAILMPADGGPWPDEAKIHESIELTTQVGPTRVVTTFTARTPCAEPRVQAARPERAEALPPGPDAPADPRAAATTAVELAAMDEAIAALQTSDAADVAALHRLRDLLRRHPDLAMRVPGLLHSGLADRVRAGCIHALELAGHEPAQTALGSVALDPQQTAMDRIRALIAVGGVAAPSTSTLGLLQRLAEERGSAGATELAHTALLGLGRAAAALRAGDPRGADAALAHLVVAAQVGPPEDRAIAWKAIANSGAASLAPQVSAALADPDPGVRAAAAQALGALGARGAPSAPVLARHLAGETDGRVRAALVGGLARVPAIPEAILRDLGSRAGGEPDGEARHSMACLLADRLQEHPGLRPVLERILASETQERTLRHVAWRLHLGGAR